MCVCPMTCARQPPRQIVCDRGKSTSSRKWIRCGRKNRLAIHTRAGAGVLIESHLYRSPLKRRSDLLHLMGQINLFGVLPSVSFYCTFGWNWYAFFRLGLMRCPNIQPRLKVPSNLELTSFTFCVSAVTHATARRSSDPVRPANACGGWSSFGFVSNWSRSTTRICDNFLIKNTFV